MEKDIKESEVCSGQEKRPEWGEELFHRSRLPKTPRTTLSIIGEGGRREKIYIVTQ